MIDDGESAKSIPLSSIRGIRLKFTPNRCLRNFYTTMVSLYDGSRIDIVSAHYAGLADFEDRSASYAPFIRVLCERAYSYNPRLSLTSGYSIVQYCMYWLLVAAGGAMIVFLGWWFFTMEKYAFVAIKAAALVALFWYSLISMRRNRPKKFGPGNIPASVLPETRDAQSGR